MLSSSLCFDVFRSKFFGKPWLAFFNPEANVLAVVLRRGSARTYLGFCVGLTPAWQGFSFSAALLSDSVATEGEKVRQVLSTLELFRKLRSPFVACLEVTDGHLLQLEARLGARRQMDVAVLFASPAAATVGEMLDVAPSEVPDSYWSFVRRTLHGRDTVELSVLWCGDDEQDEAMHTTTASWCGFDFVLRVMPNAEQRNAASRAVIAVLYTCEERTSIGSEWLSDANVAAVVVTDEGERFNVAVLTRHAVLADAFVPPSDELFSRDGNAFYANGLRADQVGDHVLACVTSLHYHATARPLAMQREELELMMGRVEPDLQPAVHKGWYSVNGRPRFVALSSRGLHFFEREVTEARVEEDRMDPRDRSDWAAQMQVRQGLAPLVPGADGWSMLLELGSMCGVELCGSRVIVRVVDAEPVEFAAVGVDDTGLRQLFQFLTAARPELVRGDATQGYLLKLRRGGGKVKRQKRVWCSLDDRGVLELRNKPGGSIKKAVSLLGATVDASSEGRLVIQIGTGSTGATVTMSSANERGSPTLPQWVARIRAFQTRLQWPDLARGVPDFFSDTVDELERRLGDFSSKHDVLGLFRVSGLQGEVERLCASWQLGAASEPLDTIETAVLCGALRSYLRSFGGLLGAPEEWYAAASGDGMGLPERLALYTRLLEQFAPEAQSLLFRLLSLLNSAHLAVTRTRMDAGGLAVVFAPVFLSDPDEHAMMRHIDAATETVRFLIVHYRCCHLGLPSSAWRHAYATVADDRRESTEAAAAAGPASLPVVTAPLGVSVRRVPSSPRASMTAVFSSASAEEPPFASPPQSPRARSVHGVPAMPPPRSPTPRGSVALNSPTLRGPPPSFAPPSPPAPSFPPPPVPLKRRATSPAMPNAAPGAEPRSSRTHAPVPIPVPRK
jgi:hypothetical protein